MRDGHYLSTHLTPVGARRAAGRWPRHDANLSLWRKEGAAVHLVAHWELERITGEKGHGAPPPDLAAARGLAEDLLRPHGVRYGDLREVWGTPGLSTGRDPFPAHPRVATHALAHLYGAALLDGDAFFDGQVLGVALARGPDPVVDGRDTSFGGVVVREGEVTAFPAASPGPLHAVACAALGLSEGALMALATATAATGRADREGVLTEFDFSVASGVDIASRAVLRVVEQVRRTCRYDPGFTELESEISAVVKEVLAISAAMVERTVDAAIAVHRLEPAETHLALAGDATLTRLLADHLLRTRGFRGLLAPPFARDGGRSIGLALGIFHHRCGRFDFRFPGPYLGREDTATDAALTRYGAFVDDAAPVDPATAADDLRAGPVMWFAGRAAVGPVALGSRSVLADPTSATAKSALNAVKRRAWWRPVTPLVLEEHVGDWFEGGCPSPFALRSFPVLPHRRARIPAVPHLDGTARVQTVTRAQNPALHDLITAFHARTGVPMLCGASLNDPGEPVLDAVDRAIDFCLRRGVPVAYVNGQRVRLRRTASYLAGRPLTLSAAIDPITVRD